MLYTIITPPGIEQPYYKFARTIPTTDPRALQQARGTITIITTESLVDGWPDLINNTDYAFAQDKHTTLPLIFNVPIQYDHHCISPLDLSFQLRAAGYSPEPTWLAHYDYSPSLRELRYLHYKWKQQFLIFNNQGPWGWWQDDLRWHGTIIHQANTILDHQIGIC